MTAKEFNSRPSDYLPELGSYEAFCVDEICAHLLIHMREEARREADAGRHSGGAGRKPVSRGPVSLEWMQQYQDQRRAAGR